MACPICGESLEWDDGHYPNHVCNICDRRAVNEDGDGSWHGWPPDEWPEPTEGVFQIPPDAGENLVFIDGQKCWRRYRFGGWVTMLDAHGCDSLKECYQQHGVF